MQRSAKISDCGRYRYRLERRWEEVGVPATFIMLNPSTADAEVDDPTIRRCIGFARDWGAAGIIVVNLFALRATDPAALAKAAAPIGPDNDAELVAAVDERLPVVAAWGAHGLVQPRAEEVKRMLSQRSMRKLMCLGVTKAGHPRHPLYVPAVQPLVTF